MWVAKSIVALVATAAALTSSSPQTPFAGSHGCVARIDSPHPSKGVIKSHTRIQCRRQVLGGGVSSQLWRRRAWGWERVGELKRYDRVTTASRIETASQWKPDGCYYYRATGRGYVISGDGIRVDTPGEGVNFDQRYLKGLPPGCGTKW